MALGKDPTFDPQLRGTLFTGLTGRTDTNPGVDPDDILGMLRTVGGRSTRTRSGIDLTRAAARPRGEPAHRGTVGAHRTDRGRAAALPRAPANPANPGPADRHHPGPAGGPRWHPPAPARPRSAAARN